MVKLIVSLVLAGLIAVGIYLYSQSDSATIYTQEGTERFQNTSDIIEGAQNAVQQTQDLDDKVKSEAQRQLSN